MTQKRRKKQSKTKKSPIACDKTAYRVPRETKSDDRLSNGEVPKTFPETFEIDNLPRIPTHKTYVTYTKEVGSRRECWSMTIFAKFRALVTH